MPLRIVAIGCRRQFAGGTSGFAPAAGTAAGNAALARPSAIDVRPGKRAEAPPA
ncbi:MULTISPECIES: hypothetical protein [Burkholderia]|uniref:hypothetical protein n=1 Tax=Burkholderia TaxID=32008 RepID=UPI001363EB8B|nr:MULTISPECIES: hypothetical protein [Burkholderia]